MFHMTASAATAAGEKAAGEMVAAASEIAAWGLVAAERGQAEEARALLGSLPSKCKPR